MRALDQDQRGEGHVHLHRADVGVGPGDELARLDPVVEGERHPGQVLVDDVAEVVLDVVGRLEEEQPGDVAARRRPRRARRSTTRSSERHGVGLERVGDGVVQEVRDLDLEHQAHEGQDQRGEEDPLVGPHDGHGPAQPDERPVGVDAGRRRLVAGHLGDRHEGGAGLGRAGRAGGAGWAPSSAPPGRAVGHEGLAPAGQAAKASSEAAGSSMASVTTPQPGLDGGVRLAEQARPSGVRTWPTRRRSPSTGWRSTRPRATRPSTTAVMVGGRTARRSARTDETAECSSSRPRIRYWGSDRSTVPSPISTCLASQAAVRPIVRRSASVVVDSGVE